jgi:hypothetical protein
MSLTNVALTTIVLFTAPGVGSIAHDGGPASQAECQEDEGQIASLVRELIAAENHHDIPAVRAFLWESPKTLFVAKTGTSKEGNWAGFWGTDVVIEHFRDLYRGTFHMAPAYDRERIVTLSCDVAEVYLPVTISVAYGGQDPAPHPFILILEWVRTSSGWRMATDVALPVPPVPPAQR